MQLSSEAIIGLVTLLVTCPPSLLVIWTVVNRKKSRRNASGNLMEEGWES